MADQNLSSSGVMLDSRIEIFPAEPLPELNSPGGPAFSARFKTETTHDLYALICSSPIPPRIESVPSFRSIDNPAIVRLIEGGVVTWVDGMRAYALVYQKPQAPRFASHYDEPHTPLSEDAINHYFITPMIEALSALSNAGMVHSAINPTNMFWRYGAAAPPQLGECLSAPAGFAQPVLFEPIERALAMPLGRGPGLHADDCYAFGVSLALLVLGHNPLQGKSDEEIIEIKLSRGSFSALVGTHRLPPSHIEILRGLLADDSRQRWTATELTQWQGGRRMTPKSSDAGRRASRNFEFLGKQYWQINTLANALAHNVPEAAKIVENDQLNKWLRRALNDEDRARAITATGEDLKSSGKSAHYEEQLVAKVCMILDPAGPIRYRGLSVLPSGLSAMTVNAVMTGNNLPIIAEIIANMFVGFWMDSQKEVRAEQVSLVQQFDHLKTLVEKTSYGNGFERIVYELNPGAPCFSPMLRGQYVTSLKMLLPALERVAASGNRSREPIDRHIAAFILVRDKRSDTLFSSMSLPENSPVRGMTLLGLYAELQYRNGPDSLPHLSAWLSPIVEPAIKRYLSKATRDRMHKLLKETVSSGNLSALSKLVDDSKRAERDKQDFIAARLLYLNIQKEIVHLESKLTNRESVVRSAGKPMAASISSFLAILLACAAILRAMGEWLLNGF